MKSEPMPLSRILVPVDFSEPSLAAWDFAKDLSGPLGASLEPVFVYEPPVLMEPGVSLPLAPMTEDFRSGLQEQFESRLGRRGTLLQGSPPSALLRYRQEKGHDLIVMGTHGRRGLARMVLGSTAEHLSRSSPVPVLSVREGWRPVRFILAPVNFRPYSLPAFFAAAALAERLGAGLDCLYVGSEPYSPGLLDEAFHQAVEGLGPYFKARPPKLLIDAGDPVEVVVARGAAYDLVALAAHAKPLFEQAFWGTTVAQVLSRSATPVLSVPAAQAEPAAAGGL